MDYEIVKEKMTGEKKRWKKRNTLNSQLLMDLLIEFEKKSNRKRLLKLNSKWRKKEKLITEWNVELMYTQLYKLSVVYYGIESKEKRKMITTEKIIDETRLQVKKEKLITDWTCGIDVHTIL